MLKFIKNQRAVMGLTLSQIGLIIASAIIIAAVFSIVFQNDWEKKAELKNIGTSFTTIVEGMDARFFENTTTFNFPDKRFEYTVTLSTEYITTEAAGRINDHLYVKERFLVRPWPLTISSSWSDGEDFHNYLDTNFGNLGTLSDPIQQVSDVKDHIELEWESTVSDLALNSILIDTNNPAYIDKTIIHYDGGEKEGFVFVYQK